MMRHARIMYAALLALTLAGTALADEPAKAESAPVPVAAPVAPKVDVMAAYKKEYAFLAAERETLMRRKAELESELRRIEDKGVRTLEAMRSKISAMAAASDEAEKEVAELERRDSSGADSTSRIQGLIEQARRTLDKEGAGFNVPEGEAAISAATVQQAFDAMTRVLERLGQVRKEAGSFFLASNARADGEIVWVGGIAAYGTSPAGGGALAPAGDGRLKAWSQPADDVAKALAQGGRPDPLKMYLFESLDAGVEGAEPFSLASHIAKGGFIGWIIAFMGIPALIMILARLVILIRTSMGTERLSAQVLPLVQAGKMAEAAALCERQRGAIARVMHTTLRNVDKDREHLEDIVSEAILHEQPHVARFEVPVTVIAAVGPLLGLLGTVSGMITTFRIITEFGTGNPKLVSGGIAEALVATQLGLLLAIPTLLAGSLLNGWADVILIQMEKAALRVMNFAYHRRNPELPL